MLSRCSGPCLPHCYKCATSTVILSHVALVYLIACAVYMIATFRLGTPFKDSLTAEQREVKKRAAHMRGRIFLLGVVIGLLAVFYKKPFRATSS